MEKYKGKMIFGTAGEDAGEYEKMFYEPEKYNLIPFKKEWEVDAKFNNMGEFGKAVTNVTKERNLGKGIVAQMKENKNTVKSHAKITKKLIEEVLSETFKDTRRIKMYTGQEGMFMFNWTLMFGDTIGVKHFRNSFSRIKGIYFSLFTKHGKYKLYVSGRTFTVYEGTKIIKVFTDIQSAQLMDFKVFDKPQIHIDKMKVINNYLKKLENGSK